MPLYRSHIVSALESIWSPPLADLIAWFKLDEGAGQTITDYASVQNGGVYAFTGVPATTQLGAFWGTMAGFGTDTGSSLGAYAYVYRSYARVTGSLALLAFIQPTGGGYWGDANKVVQIGQSSLVNWLSVAYRATVPHYWGGVPGWSPTYSCTYGNWYCIFLFSRAGTTDNGYYVRASGDSDWTTVFANTVSYGNAGNQDGIYYLGSFNEWDKVTGGDLFVWWSASSAVGHIPSLAQATAVYNARKSRYGMI